MNGELKLSKRHEGGSTEETHKGIQLDASWVCAGQDIGDVLTQLERFVAFRYVVSPVDSRKAWEDREFPEGNPQRATHVLFGYAGPSSHDSADRLVRYLCQLVWNDIIKSFPLNAHVVWRVRPQLEYYEGVLHLRCRLGCFENKQQELSV